MGRKRLAGHGHHASACVPTRPRPILWVSQAGIVRNCELGDSFRDAASGVARRPIETVPLRRRVGWPPSPPPNMGSTLVASAVPLQLGEPLARDWQEWGLLKVTPAASYLNNALRG